MPKLFPNGIVVSDVDLQALEHDLLDIEGWILGALQGKIERCKERLDREWRGRLDADPAVQNVPANRDTRISMVTIRPDYRNRADREAQRGGG